MKIIPLLLGGLLVNNFAVIQFLGVCPFIGRSNKVESATGMGIAVAFIMVIASLVTYPLHQLLVSLDMLYLELILFVVVIVALVQLCEFALRKLSPTLHTSVGAHLGAITTNCAILGLALLNTTATSVLTALISGLGAGLGFLLVIVLLAGIREKLDRSNAPKSFRGLPIVLVSAGFISMAFYIFNMIKF